VEVRNHQGASSLTISNTGSPVAAEETDRLLQPFQRLHGDRSCHDGLGLGLSIVAAIAAAHDATLALSARASGGLSVTLGFPSQATAGSSSHTRSRRGQAASSPQGTHPRRHASIGANEA
jgi:signal transduction histidine kinase